MIETRRARAQRAPPARPSRASSATTDPIAAVEDAINLRGFDEVIISTLPTKLSHWLKLDLPSKVTGMGLPVTTVTPED